MQVDLSRDIIMGHEFCGEVLELGPDTVGPAAGTLVVSVPVLLSAAGVHQLAYNNDYPGGYAEYMLLCRRPRSRGPERARRPTGCAHRAPGRGPACRGQVGGHAGRRRRGGGVRARRAGRDRRPAPGRGGDDRGLRPLAGPSASWPCRWGRPRPSTPESEPVVEAWRRLDGRRPLVAFEAVGVPGMLQQTAARRAPGTGSRWWACAWSPTRSFPSSPSPRSCPSNSRWPTRPRSSPAALRAIAEGDVDVAPMVTGTVAARRRGRCLRGARLIPTNR